MVYKYAEKQKTHQAVQFEATEQIRDAVSSWIILAKLRREDKKSINAKVFESWVSVIGLNPEDYGLRRIKVLHTYIDTLKNNI